MIHPLDSAPIVRKEYVPLDLEWCSDGALIPLRLYLEGCAVYEVDGCREDGRKASRTGCGYGQRYTIRTSCEDEENYNKLFFLYLERYSSVGAWRCEGLEIESVSVNWDQYGGITPTHMRLGDGYEYTLKMKMSYPLSTRKSDGAGMRYIVEASCPELRDDCRELALMLENGGDYIGA